MDYNQSQGHKSALQFPQHVVNYLNDEKGEKAISAIICPPPFGQSSHVSPFITRPKHDTNKCRVIVDLSFPQHFSVNDHVPKGVYMNTGFKLYYPNFDFRAN